MTKLLEEAMATARRLTDEAQDAIARMVLFYADAPFVQLTPEEELDIAEADKEAARGDFATDQDMRAIWAKYGS